MEIKEPQTRRCSLQENEKEDKRTLRTLLSPPSPTSHLSNTDSIFNYTMANMISMVFLATNELHNVANRMDPIKIVKY